MSKIAIIVALQGEVVHLVESWTVTTIDGQGRKLKVFENDSSMVVCGGIGPMAARIAAEAAYQHCNGSVRLFISAGFAGALRPSLKVGDIVRPAEVISDADGQRIQISCGNSVLISAGAIASESVKQIFAAKYNADAVDMEAYSVGDVASIYKIPFIAIKAISDELSFPMPPLGRFVDDAGKFNTVSFLGYAAIRPWLWPTISKLGKNSARAAEALGAALKSAIAQRLETSVGLIQ
jgi:purine-nucleoside phosphorylase